MNVLVATAITMFCSVFSADKKIDNTLIGTVIYVQEHPSNSKAKTKIIYTKAPTPWVKVFNN